MTRTRVVAGAIIGILLAACRSSAPAGCAAAPLSPPMVELYDGPGVYQGSARLESLTGSDRYFHLRLVDDRGQVQGLRFQGERPPLETGRNYRWFIESYGGWPSSSTLQVFDDERLVYATYADWYPGARVHGVPGFAVLVSDAGCPPRPGGECVRGVVNLAAEVQHGDARVVLLQDQTATLGEYRVHLRVAQRAGASTGQCVDGGSHGLSYVIDYIQPPR